MLDVIAFGVLADMAVGAGAVRFAERVTELAAWLTGMLRCLKAEGVRIAAYGAAAKGASLPDPRESLVTATISRFSRASESSVSANSSRFARPIRRSSRRATA